jgi:acetylornithine deacetylase/succinyl-diaminopimelate desuccinylase-like protein
MSFPPSASPMDSEFHRVLTAVAARHDPGAIITSQMLSGFTDCHFFREKGIPCYGFMPFRLSGKELGGVHGNDERLSEDNMIRGTGMMLEIVKGMAAK